MTPLNTALALPVAQPGTAEDVLAAEQQAEPVRDEASVYWAAKTADKVIAQLNQKERAYFDYATERGFVAMSKIAYAQDHGLSASGMHWDTQTVSLDGDLGELVRFRVNEVRSFNDQLVTMAVGSRPAFECVATNSDYDSIGQAETADSTVEYVYYHAYGEKKERKTVSRGISYGLSFTWVNWDPTAGDSVKVPAMVTLPDGTQAPKRDPMSGKPVKTDDPTGKRTGELHMKSLPWWQVVREPETEETDEHLWTVVREPRSKYELAGRFPEHAQRLLALQGQDDYTMARLFKMQHASRANLSTDDTVIVKHFYHAPSPALKGTTNAKGDDLGKGRYILYAGDVPLMDVPLPFPAIPIIDFCPYEYLATAFGYSPSWDLIAVNQMLDQVVSDVATNLTTFGRQSIWVEEGLGISADDIASGARVLTGKPNSKPPVPIQFAAIPEASKWFLDFLRKLMQSISRLNSVTRGDPDHNITSGQMAALFHSIAIEGISGLQLAVDVHRERVANLILDILKRYAEHEMVVQIAGVDERPYLDTFTRDSLKAIRGVTVKTANPMMRTQAGRMQIAELQLKIPGAIQDPGQLNEILVSGQSKPLYDAARKRRMRIKLEDEKLLEGPQTKMEQPPPPQPMPPPQPGMPPMPPPPVQQPYEHVPTVPVHFLDDHAAHINQHYALLASREALENQAIWKAVNVHIAHHYKVWKETAPDRLIAAGMKPYPMMAPPGAPPGGPPGPPGRPMPRVGPPGKPANDNGGPEAMKPTDQPMDKTESLGVKLPSASKSPVPGNAGAA